MIIMCGLLLNPLVKLCQSSTHILFAPCLSVHILFAPCLPVSSTCWNEGFDPSGGDFRQIAEHFGTQNSFACQTFCVANSQCTWWVYDKSSGACYIMSGTVSGRTTRPSVTTGSKLSTSCSCKFIHVSVDLNINSDHLLLPYIHHFLPHLTYLTCNHNCVPIFNTPSYLQNCPA